MTEKSWIYGERYNYDAMRWDPEIKPDECLECGTDLDGYGDRSTVGEYCPTCEVSVWIQ